MRELETLVAEMTEIRQAVEWHFSYLTTDEQATLAAAMLQALWLMRLTNTVETHGARRCPG